MPLNDADMLHLTRMLRQYMSVLDNTNFLTTTLAEVDDLDIRKHMSDAVPNITQSAMKISQLLKLIESSKQYRTMVKNFNMEEDEENGD
jgi:hypothetical protein